MKIRKKKKSDVRLTARIKEYEQIINKESRC